MRQCIERLGQAYNLYILPLMFVIVIVGIPRSHLGVVESLQQHHHRRDLVVGIFPPNDSTACLYYTPPKHTRSELRQPTPIREHLFKSLGALLRTAFTTLPCLNRTDFETLRASFVSFARIPRADAVQLTLLTHVRPFRPDDKRGVRASPLFHPAYKSNSIIRDPFSRRKEANRTPKINAEPKEDQPFRDCPISSSAKKGNVDASYTLAWLVAFAMTYGLSPAVPEIPSVGSRNFPLGKAKVHRRQAEGKRICSSSTRSCRTKMPWGPKRLRAITSMPPSPDSAVSHQHANISSATQKSTSTFSVPNAVVDLSPFKTGHYGDAHGKVSAMVSAAGTFEGAAALTQLTPNDQPALQIKIAYEFRRAALRLTLGWAEPKKNLGASSLPDFRAHSTEKERRHSLRPSSILLADPATDPFRPVPAV
ncbi:hypothetical protein EDB86DRAFT_3079631 [Lactarius hatsudake]|nr:hypothetical protein EDB86DRAFT_3079631 [Lactarius hatsudake]